MQIAILGYGNQGASALEYWAKQGHTVTICDLNTILPVPDGAQTRFGATYLADLNMFDLVVRSPSIHPSLITLANPETPDILRKVTSNTNEFFAVCPTKNIIGVTGTKGKGTTSTLITKILEASGMRVHLGGNIGTPPLELLKNNIQPDDWVVLELANFQLIDLKYSPPIAACLMVEPEHLDWHTDLAEYIAAKQQLFARQTADNFAIYYSENILSHEVASCSPGKILPYFKTPHARVENDNIVIADQVVCSVSEIALLGEHNWQNICAAITAVWQISQDIAAIKSVLTSLSGLPFRIEPRTEKEGVKFYNDSFATAPGATIAAIRAVPEKKVLIIGGHDRGLSLEPLAREIKQDEMHIRKVMIIGASAGRMTEALEAQNFSNYTVNSSKNMDDIVRSAREYAHNGDAVVLSPAFASFDMFKNFEDRGIKFNQAIEKL